MLSTIEAIYFAAREVDVALREQKGAGEYINNAAEQDQQEGFDGNTESFVDILWLFALTHSIIKERSLQEGRPVPFSEQAKAMARALRTKQGI